MPSSLVARQRPWLSVLIPVYNVEAYVQECLESVLEQADAAVEVLVLDDCSRDTSLAKVNALAARWPGRLQVLQHAHNGGLSAARNTLIDAAQGEYLWFLDSDDKLLPGAIAALQRVVQAHRPDLVLCDFQVWRERPRLKHRLRGEAHRRAFAGPSGRSMSDTAQLLQGMLLNGELHAWSKISRRALWATDLRFPPGQYFEDMPTMTQLALRVGSFYHAPEPWVAYRQRDTSILATMTLNKAIDQSRALVGFRAALAQLPSAQDAGVRFALGHQAARNLIASMRFLASQRADVAQQDTADRLRAHFALSSLLSAAELEREYLRRGWWLRWQKFRRWHGTFVR